QGFAHDLESFHALGIRGDLLEPIADLRRRVRRIKDQFVELEARRGELEARPADRRRVAILPGRAVEMEIDEILEALAGPTGDSLEIGNLQPAQGIRLEPGRPLGPRELPLILARIVANPADDPVAHRDLERDKLIWKSRMRGVRDRANSARGSK